MGFLDELKNDNKVILENVLITIRDKCPIALDAITYLFAISFIAGDAHFIDAVIYEAVYLGKGKYDIDLYRIGNLCYVPLARLDMIGLF